MTRFHIPNCVTVLTDIDCTNCTLFAVEQQEVSTAKRVTGAEEDAAATRQPSKEKSQRGREGGGAAAGRNAKGQEKDVGGTLSSSYLHHFIDVCLDGVTISVAR